MGYDIQITRSPGYHFQNEGHQISPEEWLKYVEGDPELRLAGSNGPYFAIWSGKCRYPEAWFDWDEGNIYTKNPDPAIMGKAIAIAVALGARVQGDDGEVYLPDGKIERDGVVDEQDGMDWRQW
jgi:hypothetical protein